MLLRLGGGGMGEVYRARDVVLERDVALKIISDAAAHDPGAMRRFTREAQAASALNHPNIVSVFDVGECESGPFIVMEIIEGRTLRSLLQSGPGLETLSNVGRQVARALGVAHAAGIVHRDIKPENVMVRADGYVKVVDFGLARVAPKETDSGVDTTTGSTGGVRPSLARTGDHQVLGTVAYMSPEQARGEPVGSPTDIFALGLIFYEIAARQHPFAASGKVGMVARLLSEHPVPPSHFNSELPQSLDALIVRMLDKDPRARPSADEVDRVLAELAGERESAPRPAVALSARHTVGHEAAREELLGAFIAAEAGRGVMVALSGEPGIGKTTLAEDFLRELVAAGHACLIARGRCSERLAEAGAYLPWLEALDTMRDETGGSVIRVMKTLAPTWHAQVAPLATNDSPESRLVTVNRGGSQEWMKRELSTFLDEISRHRALVLFLDDVHWADGSTLDLLAYLGARLASMRVLVLVTYRPSDAMLAKHPFLSLKLDLQSRGLCRDVGVSFLTERDIERYLTLEFPGHEFPPAFAALVRAKTEGNPLFMADLLRSFRDRQVVRKEGGVWRLTQAVAAFEREIPESIRSMIELKIARLDEADRRLLVGASVQGYEFESAVVARALALDHGDVEDRLEALGRVHALVQPVREVELPDRTLTVRYRFVHALYQNAFYASLGPTRRASLSAAVANALLGFHGAQAAALASELALLFETARDFSRAAEFFLTASERARQIFAYREALALAERGMAMLQALPETPERVPRELMHLMAVALAMQPVRGYAAPELEQTFRRARQICDQLGESPQLFGIVCGIGAFQFMRAELRATSAAIEEMRHLSELTNNPVMVIWTEWSYGATFSSIGENLRTAYERLDRGANLYDPSLHPGFMVMTGFDAGIACHFQAARVAWLLGYPDRAVARSAKTIALARSLGHPMMILFSLFFETWIRQYRREPQAVLDVTAEAVPLNDQYGYPHVSAWTRVMHGWALAQTGRVEEGERVLRDAIAQTEAIGVRLLRPNFLALLAETLAVQNRFDEALSVVADALAIADRTEERFYSAELHRLRGELLMRQGGRAGADDIEPALRTAIAIAREQETRSFELRAATTLARFLRGQGRIVEAREALDIVPSLTEGIDTPDVREARAELAGATTA